MRVEFINNWKYKGHWSKFFHFSFNIDVNGLRHLLVGLFNIFIFIVWK